MCYTTSLASALSDIIVFADYFHAIPRAERVRWIVDDLVSVPDADIHVHRRAEIHVDVDAPHPDLAVFPDTRHEHALIPEHHRGHRPPPAAGACGDAEIHDRILSGLQQMVSIVDLKLHQLCSALRDNGLRAC